MYIDPLHILNSKYNCINKYHLNPNEIPNLRTIHKEDIIQEERKKYQEILNVTKHFMNKLSLYMKGVPALFGITNENGVVIDIFGDEKLKKLFGVIPGIIFEEETAGTNSVSLCLKHKNPIQLIGEQHFHKCFFNFSCTSCLFQSIDNKYEPIVGTITLMTMIDDSSSFHPGLLSSAVDSIEREITVNVQNRKLLELNQIMMTTTTSGIVITDQDGIITSINRSAENIFQIKKSECIGKSITFITKIGEYFNNVIEKRERIENFELCFERDKSKKFLFIDILPIIDQKNELIGFFGQFRDMTERYYLEQQIIENEKLSAIGKLSAGLAHEIRNPLTPIMGFVQLLEKYHFDESYNLYINIITEELQRVKQLVDNFVLTSKPEAPSRKITNVVDLINQTISLMKSEEALKNIQIEVVNQLEEIREISIDSNQIKQVLINLIQNAMDVTPTGGKIIVQASNIDNGILIFVKDQGLGISEEEKQQLFSPFFTTKEDGVGLGLSICERIIKNHQGKIMIDSQVGEGSTFKIYLPLNQGQEV